MDRVIKEKGIVLGESKKSGGKRGQVCCMHVDKLYYSFPHYFLLLYYIFTLKKEDAKGKEKESEGVGHPNKDMHAQSSSFQPLFPFLPPTKREMGECCHSLGIKPWLKDD